MTNSGKKPFQKFQEGSVTVAVYKNDRKDSDGNDFTTLDAVPQKSYRDKEGKWQSSNTYSPRDISNAVKAMQRAENFMQQYQFEQDNKRNFGKPREEEQEQGAGY